ncbi:MAG: PEP-CTERM sorting domain-containing protein [Terrimicrobiaceae bacterium]|nr:PEP-CTERM sorting domain-containing protein [Terrimicrobiaceae bacterium]
MRLLPSLFVAGCLATLAHAQVGTDVASNYVSWTSGSNGGSGFNPWGFLVTTGTLDLADSTAGAGNINTGGVSFRMAGGGSNSAEAARSFAGGVSLGTLAVFTFDLSVNFRNGNKGFDLRNGGDTVFNFNVGGDNYFFGGVDLGNQGWGYVSDGVYSFEFEITSATTMRAAVTRTSVGTPSQDRFYEIASYNLTAPIDNFKFYINGTDAAPVPQNSLYFNNLTVVPEPTTVTLLSLGLVLTAVGFRRRVRRDRQSPFFESKS